MKTKATRKDAYNLLHQGTLALAEIERNGMKVDMAYIDKAISKTDAKVKALEEELRNDPTYDTWRSMFGVKASIHSPIQFRKVLNQLGHRPQVEYKGVTKDSVTAKALEQLDLPFARKWTRMRSLEHTKGTYLEGLRDGAVDGYLHPNFTWNPRSYRTSSGSEEESASGFNTQNVSARNQEQAEIARKAFIPRKGNILLEVDFKTLEVAIGCCLHLDRNMIRYLKDPKSDMHRDIAKDMFCLDPKIMTKWPDEAKSTFKKTLRDAAKNGVTFPMFYGSVWFQCAPAIWDRITRGKWNIPDTDIPVTKWLKTHGIKELGDCEPGTDPEPNTFADHMRKLERNVWDNMFPDYRDWKRDTYNDYLERGWFEYVTGFLIEGYYRKNQVVNYVIQGPSFHCLLWTLIQVQKWIKRYRMKTKIVNQIHDSGICDVPKREFKAVVAKFNETVEVDLPKHWDWINIPLRLEMEASDQNWYAKHEIQEYLSA